MLVTPFSADMNAHIEKYLTNLGLTVFPGPPYDKTRKPGAGVEINPDELFRRVEASYRQNPTTQAIYFQGATLDPLPIQFVAMVFCQMGAAHSLREICGGLATATGKLVPSGPYQAPTRSTLAYANTHRPWQLYQTVFEDLLKSCQALAATKKRRFRFKHPLRNLDASVIELCVKVFDWARFQRTKGAIKLHLQLDHQGYLPCWAVVTDGDTNDVRVAQKLKFAPGTIVVMDRGYLDYALYERWNQDGVYFVTRTRTNMV